MSADLSNPTDPVVVTALQRKCECGAEPKQHCVNIIDNSKPLPGKRVIHYARVQKWDVP